MTDSLNIGPFVVTVYHGETDSVPVVQIDGGGSLRVNVNDAPVFDRGTEDAGRNADGSCIATVADVAYALSNTEYDPAKVLAQVLSAFGPSSDAADLVDALGGILGGINDAAGLPALDSDDDDSVDFWDQVALNGGVF